LRGATALTAEPDKPVIENSVVGIRGDRIALLPSAEAGAVSADRIIDARGHVLTPGFVNIHTHAGCNGARHDREPDLPAYTRACHTVTRLRKGSCSTGATHSAGGHAVRFDAHQRYVHTRTRRCLLWPGSVRISSWLIHDVDFDRRA
jgi:5-methylthioadenosine/S-adenosylhomocysteine deaminase